MKRKADSRFEFATAWINQLEGLWGFYPDDYEPMKISVTAIKGQIIAKAKKLDLPDGEGFKELVDEVFEEIMEFCFKDEEYISGWIPTDSEALKHYLSIDKKELDKIE